MPSVNRPLSFKTGVGHLMTLKIICIEEHITDRSLKEAAWPKLARLAPYLADYGIQFQDDPAANANGLPQCESPRRADEIEAAPIAARLPEMDEHGIDMQVLSYPIYCQYAPIEAAIGGVKAANNRLAAAIADQPDRFAGFSILPWQSPEAAVAEIERSAGELGLTGTMLAGLPAVDTFLDDPRFSPILAKLEAMQVPLYLHPGPPMRDVQRLYFTGFDNEVTNRLSMFSWGFHHEAGLQVVRLMLSGVLDRFPGLRIISGHLGEMVPYYLHRLDETLPIALTGLSRTILQTYRDQVYVTPSGMLNTAHMMFLREVISADRIIFSMDYPWMTLTGARAWLENLPISASEREAIAHGNAERLLRLPA